MAAANDDKLNPAMLSAPGSGGTADSGLTDGGGERQNVSGVFFEPDGTLEKYLKSLSSLELLDHAAESGLWNEIIVLQNRFREKIYCFGFAFKRSLKLIESCSDPDDYNEIFPQSALRNKKVSEIVRHVSSLKTGIARILAEMRDAFLENDKNELARLRAEGNGLLAETPLLIEYIFRFFEDIRSCALSGRGDGSDGSPDRLLEAELLCTRSEFETIYRELEELYTELDRKRRRIAEGNLRLVVSIAKHFHGRGVPFMDLIQEGNVGLMKAIDRFDFPLGHHFSTYATWWIRQCVSHAAGRQSRVIRLPVHMLNTLSKINRAEQKLLQELGREPEAAEVAAHLDMSVERVNSMKKMSVQAISLQASVFHDGEGEKTTLEDSHELCDADDPMRALARKTLSERLSETIAALPPRCRDILKMRYGLEGETLRSLNEISDHFKISRERIRQIESRALSKLRDPSTIKLFEDYFS